MKLCLLLMFLSAGQALVQRRRPDAHEGAFAGRRPRASSGTAGFEAGLRSGAGGGVVRQAGASKGHGVTPRTQAM